MKKLQIFYNRLIHDVQRDKYLKYITERLTDVEIIIVNDVVNNYHEFKMIPTLFLEPMTDFQRGIAKSFFTDYPHLDVEHKFTTGIPITVEAILRLLPENLGGELVLIRNQSDNLGKPLAMELMNRRATVVSVNSYGVSGGEYFYPDYIISATHGSWTFTRSNLRPPRMIIDLSNDYSTDDELVVRSVPTTTVLQERVNEFYK